MRRRYSGAPMVYLRQKILHPISLMKRIANKLLLLARACHEPAVRIDTAEAQRAGRPAPTIVLLNEHTALCYFGRNVPQGEVMELSDRMKAVTA